MFVGLFGSRVETLGMSIPAAPASMPWRMHSATRLRALVKPPQNDSPSRPQLDAHFSQRFGLQFVLRQTTPILDCFACISRDAGIACQRSDSKGNTRQQISKIPMAIKIRIFRVLNTMSLRLWTENCSSHRGVQITNNNQSKHISPCPLSIYAIWFSKNTTYS